MFSNHQLDVPGPVFNLCLGEYNSDVIMVSVLEHDFCCVLLAVFFQNTSKGFKQEPDTSPPQLLQSS